MRKSLIALALSVALAPAGFAAAVTLRVVATNVKSDQGSIVVWVYDNADKWLGDGWRTQKVTAVAGNRKALALGPIIQQLLLGTGRLF